MLIGTVDRGGRRRLGLIGSCRLHDPLKAAITSENGMFEWSANNAFSHSLPEAVQHLDFCLGKMEVPDPFAPYILKQDRMPILDPRLPKLAASCDLLVVEISSFEVLRCGHYLFNSDYFGQRFIRGKGLPALEWQRGLSELPQPPEVATKAEEALERSGGPLPPSQREILRTLRREPVGDNAALAAVARLRAVCPNLLLMPLFAVPDATERLAETRAALLSRVMRIADLAGVATVDPSPAIEEAGRKAALDGDGADFFHYAPSFMPRIGAWLLDRILATTTTGVTVSVGAASGD